MDANEVVKRLKKGEDPLELAVEKWQRIVDGTGENFGIANCALCHIYAINKCRGCPVYEATREPYCAFTPYDDYSLEQCEDFPDPQKLKEHAIRELEFLKSLRKKER